MGRGTITFSRKLYDKCFLFRDGRMYSRLTRVVVIIRDYEYLDSANGTAPPEVEINDGDIFLFVTTDNKVAPVIIDMIRETQNGNRIFLKPYEQ